MGFPKIAGMPNGAEKVTASGRAGNDGKLGFLAQTDDGRVFRYMKNGGTALAAGVVVQSPAVNSSNDAALPVTATSSGTFTVTPTIQAPITKDQFAGGFVIIDTAPGEGLYKIASNDSGSSGVAVAVTLEGNDPLRNALTTATRVGLRENPYNNVVVAPTTIAGLIAGVTPTAIDSGNYFWGQVSGLGVLNTDGAPAINTGIIMGASAGHGVARSSALNDVPDITIARGIDAAAGADKVNFVQIAIE